MTYSLRRKFERCSPVLAIQKTIKMFVSRKKYFKKKKMTALLVWALNRWQLRGHIEFILKKMGLSREFLFMIGRIRYIQHSWRFLWKCWKLGERFAYRAQSIYRMKLLQNETIDYALGLNVRS